MYSKEYVRKTLIRGRDPVKAGFYYAHALGMIAFLLVSVLAAPLIHELAHMAVLELHHCYYVIHLEYNSEYGIHGSIDLACALSRADEVAVYGAGVMSNLVIASALFILVSVLYRRGRLLDSISCMYLAFGFISDPLFYLFASKGDIVYMLEALGRRDWIWFIPVLGIVLFAFSILYLYLYMERFFADYAEMEKEIDDIEEFIAGRR